MICVKCDNDLAACVCKDLKERMESILHSPYIHVGKDYAERIKAQAERNLNEQEGAI